MRVCSLFCGIGGIDVAFEQASHNVVWANDSNRYACMTYRYNFPSTYLVESDIRDVDKHSIPDFDVLVAGFPCQPFSVCGKQKGFSDERGNLFFEIVKTIDAKQPTVVFLENVANLTEHDNGKTFNVIFSELAGRGYYVRYIVADACNYGIPQHRTRTYIMAFKSKNACDAYSFPEKIPITRRIADVIDFSIKAEERFYYREGTAKYHQLCEAIVDEKQLYRFSDWGIQAGKDGIAFTLKANMGTYPNRVPIIKDHYGIRNITPMECLALHGFPKTFAFPDTVPEREQYKQAGNTVCVEIIKRCASIEGSPTPNIEQA
ncbi:MAG: DNA (cytosine-5-)-methyltransferase [Clostridia bacterium]|nr:DNA (cytosine-5-)-methyltransferase [Clostridia bacterium]